MVDVFEREPFPADSPLADAPNAVLTAPIAGVPRESNMRVSSLVARKVAEALLKIGIISRPRARTRRMA